MVYMYEDLLYVHTDGGFIKDEFYSWVQYKSGPGGRPSM
jgi:hypothetical protein